MVQCARRIWGTLSRLTISAVIIIMLPIWLSLGTGLAEPLLASEEKEIADQLANLSSS